VGIGAAFGVFKAASLVNTAVTAFKAFKTANEGATVAQWLMNAAMNANPITLIVTLVAGLVAALITFIATNEDARAKIVEMWEKVKAAFVSFGEKAGEIFDKVKNYFSGLGDKAAEIWANIKSGARDAWEGIKNTFSKVASFFGEKFGAAWEKVKSIFSTGGKIFDGNRDTPGSYDRQGTRDRSRYGSGHRRNGGDWR
jgi:phage-related protein